MELFKPGLNIDFVGKIKYCLIISSALILMGIISLIVRGGPNYGIDFAGGTDIQVKFFSNNVGAAAIRKALAGAMEEVSVQSFGEEGNEYLVKVRGSGDLEKIASKVKEAFLKKIPNSRFEIRRVEMVGPKVGRELRRAGIWAVFFAIIGILIYISWRFEFKYALGGIIALFHDVFITFGAFSVTNKEVNLSTLAALLTIGGYSINDTIVVFDRIRENIGRRTKIALRDVINSSINETLGRTIITSGTTLLAALALFSLGGPIIRDFAFAFIVGIIIGTYSSIYIASPVIIMWENLKERQWKIWKKSIPSQKVAVQKKEISQTRAARTKKGKGSEERVKRKKGGGHGKRKR